MKIAQTTLGNRYNIIAPAIISVVLLMFLFYIDEGYYNFSWTLDFRTRIIFFIYTGVFYVIQMVIQVLIIYLFKKHSVFFQLLLPAILAIALGYLILDLTSAPNFVWVH